MNSLIKHEPTEVMDPKQSAAILARCEKQITTLHGQLAKGENLNKGLRFLIGCEMITARPHIPLAGRGNTGDASEGDGFENWVRNNWPTLHERSAQRYMKLASTVLAAAPKCKSDTVSLLRNTPQLLAQGELDLGMQEQICAAAAELIGDRSDAEFIKEFTPKPARKITFSCPHCGAKNEGIFGREYKCVNRECGERIKAKDDAPTPEETVKARIAQANDLMRAALNAVQLIRGHDHAMDADAAVITAFRDECIEGSKAAKAWLKKRKQPRSRR